MNDTFGCGTNGAGSREDVLGGNENTFTTRMPTYGANAEGPYTLDPDALRNAAARRLLSARVLAAAPEHALV